MVLKLLFQRQILGCVFALAFTFAASSASAQFLANPDDRPELFTMSTTTSSAVVVGAILLTVANVGNDPVALRHYLDDNEVALRMAMSTGAGDTIDDLGAFFGVSQPEEHRAFARMLRFHRERLTRLAFETRDVTAFRRTVREAMAFDPRLRGLLDEA